MPAKGRASGDSTAARAAWVLLEKGQRLRDDDQRDEAIVAQAQLDKGLVPEGLAAR